MNYGEKLASNPGLPRTCINSHECREGLARVKLHVHVANLCIKCVYNLK